MRRGSHNGNPFGLEASGTRLQPFFFIIRRKRAMVRLLNYGGFALTLEGAAHV